MIKDEYASDKRTVLEVRVKSVLPDAVYQKKLSEKNSSGSGKIFAFSPMSFWKRCTPALHWILTM